MHVQKIEQDSLTNDDRYFIEITTDSYYWC